MKNLYLISFLLFCLASCGEKTFAPRFLIVENGKMGFIDSSGKVIVKPQFHDAGEFSEGLAQVRINGRYGYIHESGKFAIQPTFEFAMPFSEGLAIVYNNGKSFFIDPSGKKAFDCPFAQVSPFKNGRATVKTASGKCGALNPLGKLFIDTVYSEIEPFEDGLAIVRGLNKENRETGVIDSLGKFVFPYKRYARVDSYSEGYFRVNLHPKNGKHAFAFVDRKGKVLLARTYTENEAVSSEIHNGLIGITTSKINEQEPGVYSSTNFHAGFLNLKGEMCISDTSFEHAEDFSENRTFVYDGNGYFIIDRKGKKISKHRFSSFTPFENGISFVQTNFLWGIIDTNGHFLVQPKHQRAQDLGTINDYLVFPKHDEKKDKSLYGIIAKNGKTIAPNVLEEFDSRGFVDGLLKCTIDGRLAYINQSGKIVWQEQKKVKTTKPLPINIDHQLAGHFYADSETEAELSEYGVRIRIPENPPRKISQPSLFKANALGVYVVQNQPATFNEHAGFTVYVANQSNAKQFFNVQDGRLEMVVQARNAKGEWKTIESMPRSWCGNSYGKHRLNPSNCWQFATPQHEGELKTKCRIELKYIDPENHENEVAIYSNEYDAGINPGQFWRTQAHVSFGIMDPYLSAEISCDGYSFPPIVPLAYL